MNFQHLFAMSSMGLGVESMYFIAIGVLACVLGAEIAGICILIRKMKAARRASYLQETEDSAERYHSQHAGVILLGAVPAAAQISLFALSIAAAVAALVFVILLIVFRAKGYSLISPAALRTSEQAPAEETPAPAVEETPIEELSVAETPAEEIPFVEEAIDEEQQQEAYTEAFALMEEEPIALDEEAVEEPTPAEETVTAAESAPVAVLQRPAPAYTPAPGIPIYSSAYPGGQPVIEKHITETVREVIKETNTTTTTEGGNAHATEEILKAIAELMKLGTQLRMEKEMAVQNPVIKNEESVDAMSSAVEEPEVEDIEDDEDLELDEAENASDEEEGEGADDDYESELFTGNERIVGFDEETGCYIVAHYRKSFEAKLIQARPDVKKYYSEIKNALLAYEDTKDRITWNGNAYSNDRAQIAKINVRQRTLDLYLALDPASLEDSVYHGRDVGDKKKYAETPFLFKVNSPRKLTLALELVRRTCEEQGLSPIDIDTVNYEEQYPFESTEDLIRRGLIREYLREEKPAVTFELDPDHSPDLPEEDGSVIPANANFTWEIDEEAEHAEEPTPEPEPEPAPAPAEEPAQINIDDALADVLSRVEEAKPSAPTTTTTTRETVKTTERHYTEHSYSVGGTTYTETLLSDRAQPIAAIAEAETVEEAPAQPIPEVAEKAPVENTPEEVEEAPLDEEPEETVEETEDAFEEAPEEIEEEPIEETEDELSWSTQDAEEVFDDVEEEILEDAADAYGEEMTEETEEVYAEEDAEEEYEEEAYEETPEEYEEVYEDDEVAYEEEADEGSEEAVEEIEVEEIAPVAPPKPVTDSTVALLDVCIFDDYFENGAIVNLETLKQMDLVPATAQTLKVYASGALKGQFTVEANHFTLDAIKAIGDADGDSIMIR